jgi:cyanate permease
MAGLNLRTGLGGVQPAQVPTYSNAGTPSVMAAAFGSGVTVPVAKQASGISPSTPTGLTFWVGVAAVAMLVFIRQSLPQ